jgi:FkbM family methyltransferase
LLARTLTAIAARIPSSIKYRLSWARGAYTQTLAFKQAIVTISTECGSFQWKVDGFTHQQHIRGTVEPYMQEAYRRFVRPGMIAYDIGASVGFHTLLLATLGAKVYSFEPNPSSRTSLTGQLTANPGLAVQVEPYALSDHAGRAYLKKSLMSMANLSETGDIEVETKTIDEIDLPPPDVMKIDVEGHELRVLRGGLAKLEQFRPVILCDYHDDHTFPEVKKLLEPLGYRVTYEPPICAVPEVS